MFHVKPILRQRVFRALGIGPWILVSRPGVPRETSAPAGYRILLPAHFGVSLRPGSESS